MTPNKSYKVLVQAEILGTVRAVGDVVELDDHAAAALLEAKVIEEVKEEGGEGGDTPAPTEPTTPTGNEGEQAAPPTPETPAASVASEATGLAPAEETPGEPAPAPSEKTSEKGWVGGHTVGANESPTQRGGGLRTPHPDMVNRNKQLA